VTAERISPGGREEGRVPSKERLPTGTGAGGAGAAETPMARPEERGKMLVMVEAEAEGRGATKESVSGKRRGCGMDKGTPEAGAGAGGS